MRWLRAVRRPMAALAGALGVVGAGTVAVPAAGAPEDVEGGLTVEITDMAPAVLRPGEPLTVSGRVVNDGGQDVDVAELQLNMQRYAPISRIALQRWMNPDSYAITSTLAVDDLGEIPAGSSTQFSLELQPEDLGILNTSSGWGPHGVEVAVSDASGQTTISGVDRSVALWYPGEARQAQPTRVSAVVPVTASATERAAARADPGDDAVAQTAAPRLLELLEAIDEPGVTAAVDGELFAAPDDPAEDATADEETSDDGTPDDPTTQSPDETGTDEETTQDEEATEDTTDAEEPSEEDTATNEPTDGGTLDEESPDEEGTDEGSTDESATDAAALREALAALAAQSGREVAVLPWADADIAALAHLGAGHRLGRATENAIAAADAAGISDAQPLAWPATRTPDVATLAAAARAGATTAVVPVSATTPLDELTYTPTGRADLDVGRDGSFPAVLTDDVASAILAGRLPPVDDGGQTRRLNALDSRQLLLADTAVITRERPNDQRAIALNASRSPRLDVDRLGENLETLLSAPWIEPAGLSEIREMDAPELDRDTLPEQRVSDQELSGDNLDEMDDIRDRAEAFAAITDPNEVLLEPVDQNLSSLLSAAWRRDTDGRESLLSSVSDRVATLDDQLAPLQSSSLNVINYSASMPVHIRNDLPVDATVKVRLVPSDQRLQADEEVEVTVPAESQGTAQVPVRAVGSGNVTVEVQLLGADGRTIGTPSDLQVRVRADWESVGTAVVAGLLGVMLVVGLVRTVRRGRRADPATAEEVEP